MLVFYIMYVYIYIYVSMIYVTIFIEELTLCPSTTHRFVPASREMPGTLTEAALPYQNNWRAHPRFKITGTRILIALAGTVWASTSRRDKFYSIRESIIIFPCRLITINPDESKPKWFTLSVPDIDDCILAILLNLLCF